MHKAVIIVAGGIGLRMNSGTPKQFMELNGRPILMHTIIRFYEFQNDIKIIVVLPEDEIEEWNSLLKKHAFTINHEITVGGNSRFYSVKNGLQTLQDNYNVAIHDGVRPFCSPAFIKRCFETSEKKSNAIPCLPITETIREINNENNFLINRENLRIIQTPQCFDSTRLIEAYRLAEQSGKNNFTDDAGVYENAGNKINLVEGEKYNIKITVPEDLVIASVIEKEYFKK